MLFFVAFLEDYRGGWAPSECTCAGLGDVWLFVRLSDCQIVRLSDCQIVRLLHWLSVISSDCQIVSLSDGNVTARSIVAVTVTLCCLFMFLS